MEKTFDELADDFLRNNRKRPIKSLDQTGAEKLIDILNNFSVLENVDEGIENGFDISLGKPDEIKFYMEGDLYYEKRIWHTVNGDLIKLIISDEPNLSVEIPNVIIPLINTKSLQKLLDDAIEIEDYETASEIRDEIKKNNKTTKKPK